VALDATGNILVIDQVGVLFRVNPITGARTLLSNFDTAAQGPLGDDPVGVALNGLKTALVVDRAAGTSGRGALFTVSLLTGVGDRTLLRDFGSAKQGPLGQEPQGVTLGDLALGLDRNILVIDLGAGTNGKGALFSVNPINGNRIVLSDFGNAAQGPLGLNPAGVARIPVPSGAGLSGAWQRVAQNCRRGGEGSPCELYGVIEVFNPGTATAAPTALQFFLSEDESLDEEDLFLQEVTVGRLKPGQTRTEQLRATVNGDASGSFVIAVLDATNVVAERNEANNVVVSPPIP